MDRVAKEQELSRLRGEVARLERELVQDDLASKGTEESQWPPKGYYFTYDALAGCMLGLFGATTSLLFNIVGALLVPPPPPLSPHPLNLIRVYLTFPLKESALATDSGIALAIGCCLYLGTGMLLGIPFQVAQTRLLPNGTFLGRMALATFLGVIVWLINFYGILYWLQPLLFGGRWIVDQIPVWVALMTHVVFGWTMAILYPWGVFVPYRRAGETA